MQPEGIVEIARGEGLAEAWERAVTLAWERGSEFVHEDTGDSYRGRPMVIELPRALGEPRYHRMIMALPSDIESYIQEVVAGSKDHLIDLADPNKWHYCVHPDTPVLMADYREKAIRDCVAGDDVVVYDFEAQTYVRAPIERVVRSYSRLHAFELEGGGGISTSEVHPLYVMGRGWLPARDIAVGERVAVAFDRPGGHGLPHGLNSAEDGPAVLSQGDVLAACRGMNGRRIVSELTARGLLPFRPLSEKGLVACALLGYLFGDGWLGSPRRKKTSKHLSGTVNFSGEYAALTRIQQELRFLGFTSGRIQSIWQECTLRTRQVKGCSLLLSCGWNSLWGLFRALGAPVGDKPTQPYLVPQWVPDIPQARKAFLAGFLDAECAAPHKPAHARGSDASVYFRQVKAAGLEGNLASFVQQLQAMLRAEGVAFQPVTALRTREGNVSMGLRIGSAADVASFCRTFPFVFSFTKAERQRLLAEYASLCRSTGRQPGRPYPKGLPSWGEWLGDRAQWRVAFRKVVSRAVSLVQHPVVDISVAHRAHNFVGNGILCHNTYHERFTRYTVPSGEVINQIETLLDHLAQKPNSRRAQAITWKPWMDPEEKDPPCLQRLWCIVQDGRLNMHTHWRSREAILASYMNVLALTTWQGMFAQRLGVGVGHYLDFTDSFHIYQRDYPRAEMLVGKFRTAPPEARFMSEELYRSLL